MRLNKINVAPAFFNLRPAPPSAAQPHRAQAFGISAIAVWCDIMQTSNIYVYTYREICYIIN